MDDPPPAPRPPRPAPSAAPAADPDRVFRLRLLRPAPGAGRDPDGAWTLAWRGCAVMGVLNVTPDSFSDGGRWPGPDAAAGAARAMARAGALMVDVGGESTRPGAEPVDEAEELRRVLPVVEAVAADGAVLVSVDTSKPAVADAALERGAHLINDVTGLRDPDMLRVLAERGAPGVAMHMRGEPRTMQRGPRYGDVVAEVAAFLEERLEAARAAGVPDVMVDPGIGFGKTLEHNLALLAALDRLPDAPRLVGASRKGMIAALAGGEPAPPAGPERDPGTLALHLHAARAGAAMVRVHDVPGHVQALRVQAALLRAARALRTGA